MTRFVYVLPAGRFRWEVRADLDPLRDAIRRAKGLMTQYYDADVPHEVIELIQDLRVTLELPDVDDRPLFYRRKTHALIAARAIAILIGGEVQPHDRRGRIQDPDSYGSDPERSVG